MNKNLYDAFTDWQMNCIVYDKTLKQAFTAGFESSREAVLELYEMLAELDYALDNDAISPTHANSVKKLLDKYQP